MRLGWENQFAICDSLGGGGGVPDWWGLMGKSQGLDPFNFWQELGRRWIQDLSHHWPWSEFFHVACCDLLPPQGDGQRWDVQLLHHVLHQLHSHEPRRGVRRSSDQGAGGQHAGWLRRHAAAQPPAGWGGPRSPSSSRHGALVHTWCWARRSRRCVPLLRFLFLMNSFTARAPLGQGFSHLAFQCRSMCSWFDSSIHLRTIYIFCRAVKQGFSDCMLGVFPTLPVQSDAYSRSVLGTPPQGICQHRTQTLFSAVTKGGWTCLALTSPLAASCSCST